MMLGSVRHLQLRRSSSAERCEVAPSSRVRAPALSDADFGHEQSSEYMCSVIDCATLRNYRFELAFCRGDPIQRKLHRMPVYDGICLCSVQR